MSGTSSSALPLAVRARSPHAIPRVSRPGRPCVYIRRSAIDLVGQTGSGWADEAGESDFFARCLQHGLCHAIADDVLVSSTHRGVSPADRGEGPAAAPLARSLGAGRRASNGLSVVIDARILDGRVTGTQVHVMELIAAVARTGQARVRAVVGPALDAKTGSAFRGLRGVEVVSAETAAGLRPGDLVHRPFQVSSAEDLIFLRRLGERLVVTHQDMIGYRNPSYFSARREWDEYRRLTRRALAVADRAVFFSAHALGDALAEDLIHPGRGTVVPIGVDHGVRGGRRPAIRQPAAVRASRSGRVILCLGTDLRHKNRVFALRWSMSFSTAMAGTAISCSRGLICRWGPRPTRKRHCWRDLPARGAHDRRRSSR